MLGTKGVCIPGYPGTGTDCTRVSGNLPQRPQHAKNGTGSTATSTTASSSTGNSEDNFGYRYPGTQGGLGGYPGTRVPGCPGSQASVPG
eukprot:1755043-Rhodomonas_salina.5